MSFKPPVTVILLSWNIIFLFPPQGLPTHPKGVLTTVSGVYLYCLRIWIPKIWYLCCLTFLRQETCIVFGNLDKYYVLSQMTNTTKNVFDTQDIWPYWRKRKKTKTIFFFICKSESKTIGGIKYKKSTIQNQSVIQKYFFLPMGPPRCKMKNQHV
jgi:hypothetical protein